MENNGFLKNKAVKLTAIVLAVLLVAGFFAFMITQLRAQQRKLDELSKEKAQLVERLAELQRDQERIESNLEYVKSLEGLLRYAREHYGYIGEGDVRIDVDD
ncbi:MAG: septum formation initiator family protein [Clostridia bacterium]|nr:septum formation initiator family protein [Clostridia bacterium]